jgi:hypothetical protein
VQLVPVALHEGVGVVEIACTAGTTTAPRITDNELAKIIIFGLRELFFIFMQIKIKLQHKSCWSFTQPKSSLAYKHLGQSSL